MIYSNKDLLEKYKTRYNISKALKNKKIIKIGHGIYSDKDIINPLVIISKKYSSAIITMNSAFYYYKLTDVKPKKIYVATNRNSNTINNKKVVQIRVSKEILNQGEDFTIIDGDIIKIYNKERLLVELIRKRNSLPYDYYKEIILNYSKIVDELDVNKIEEYLALYKNESNLKNTLFEFIFNNQKTQI